MVDNSTSVVKRDLEVTNSEEETQSISSPPTDNTVINHLDSILDTAAVQVPVVKTVQIPEIKSAKEQKKSQEKNSSDKESINMMIIEETFSLFKDILGIFKTLQGIIYMIMMVLMFNMGFCRAAAVPEQIQTLTPTAAVSK